MLQIILCVYLISTNWILLKYILQYETVLLKHDTEYGNYINDKNPTILEHLKR